MKLPHSLNTIIALCVLGFSLTAFEARAQTNTDVWNPAQAYPNVQGLWSNPTNWTLRVVPNANLVVVFNVGGAIPAVLDDTAGTVTVWRMNLGDGTGTPGTLIVTNGGNFTAASDYCAVAYGANSTGLLDVESNSTMTFDSHLWVGLNPGAVGTLVVNGGTVNVSGNFGLGYSGGSGLAHINGGTLNLNQLNPGPGTSGVGINNFSTMDITHGTVDITNGQASTMQAYVSAGRLTAYGGTGTVIINPLGGNGAKITAITNSSSSSGSFPQVIIPTLDTNEIVIASATPQEYGAVGDGITDDSAAFQNAMNAVYNSGGFGGGVVYVPAGNYAFYNPITIPTGVTLQGDWQDWTRTGGGLAGTTFKVYYGAGQTNAAPFIFVNGSTELKDVNIWYPNQDPNNITGYPWSIGVFGDCLVQNVALVNSYQGIQVNGTTGGAKHIFSTIVGTPLYKGISVDGIYDISHSEDIRFSPAAWAESSLTNAPLPGGAYATWMRTYGEGMQLLRVDGEACMDIDISGYDVGIEANQSTNGAPGATFYSGTISNCATAVLAQVMPFQSGLQFAKFNIEGDVAVSHTSNTMATLQFYDCQLTGANGTAVDFEGAANNWVSWAQFQDCTVNGTLLLDSGVFNVVDSSLNVSQGGNQAVLGANATRAAFTGCNFSPVQSIVNSGNTNRVIVDGRRPVEYPLPFAEWTNIYNDYLSRKPAKNDLFVVTNSTYGAKGNGSQDDTAAIQKALTAAGNNGGGIVYLPGGMYHLTNTLDVPAGVVLHGPYEGRHRTWPGPDNVAKGAVLQPYGGQGTTNGPVAIALEANSGLVGVTISYEDQTSNCIPYPATIQCRGGNDYVIGVVCPNPYYYVDLDTYTCTNHLIYMVDGWALNLGYFSGNGSSGSIVDCHGNWTYWWDNYDSNSELGGSGRPNVDDFAEHNLNMYTFGNCTELLVKDFVIPSHTFIHCISENGLGPNVTGVGTMCDETGEGFRLEGGPCNLSTVNSTLAIFAEYPDLDTNTVGVISTNTFQGTARFFNTALFGGPYWDFISGGGEENFGQVHMLDHSFLGSRVDGGVMQLVNNGAYISYNGASNFPPYNIAFGAGAGISGHVSEMIGCYAYNGCSFQNPNGNNPVLSWVDYNLNTPLVHVANFTVTPPKLVLGGSGQNSTLTWPASEGAFDLYYTPSLSSPDLWTVVTNTQVYANGNWTVTVPDVAGAGFYYLQQ